METIRGKFLKGTKRKDGSIRYEIEAPKVTKSDRMAAIDFEDAEEVEIRIPDKKAQVQPSRDVALAELRTMLERVTDFIEEQKADDITIKVQAKACDGCERQAEFIEKAENAITEEEGKE